MPTSTTTRILYIMCLFFLTLVICTFPAESEPSISLKPTVFIPILARNKEHTLPTFFGCLERLDYPKDRISLWIRSDHNIDNTTSMLLEWVSKTRLIYHHVDLQVSNDPQEYDWERGPTDWTQERFDHVINMRQSALDAARHQWADYLFAIDVDNFLENPDILNQLIAQRKTVIAPMLESSKMYSNFWGGTTKKGYYKRTEQYVLIFKRNITGVYQVPMVHSTYLVDLRRQQSTQLSYDPLPGFDKDIDDMLTFAYSAAKAGVPFYVSNLEYYGCLLIPVDERKTLQEDVEQMIYLRLEAMAEDVFMPVSDHIYIPPRPTSKLGFDEIYMINLKRRPERREKMVASFKELGIAYRTVDAVDGRALTDGDLKELGVDMLPGYRDPYHERVLTRGEIGCFLSHYFIWQDMVKNHYRKIIIFEDDIRFKMSFRPKMEDMLREIKVMNLRWEMIYIGRKIMEVDYENYLPGYSHIVKPSYTYWTLCYMLSLDGAVKLLSQEPLKKMIPVDEYLPIMFDVHPENGWAYHFGPRDLKAYSVNPLFVEPTHYTGAENYISDTETKDIWEYVLEREGKQPTKDVTKKQKDSSQSPKSDKGKWPNSTEGKATLGKNKDVKERDGQKQDTANSTHIEQEGGEPGSKVKGGTEQGPTNEVNTHSEL